MSKIVPFGKYKDRPVEDMLADTKYLEWLTQQTWFEDRYPVIYKIVHTTGMEPAETPEHNALQARFLDDDFVRRTLKLDADTKIDRRSFELHGWDVTICVVIAYHPTVYWVEIKPSVGDDYPAILRQMKRNFSVFRQGQFASYRHAARLYTQSISTKYLTVDQVVAMFETSGIGVIIDPRTSILLDSSKVEE